MNDGIVTRLSWIFLAGMVGVLVIAGGFSLYDGHRGRKEDARIREASRQTGEEIKSMEAYTEGLQRKNQIERAKLNKARESEIMRIEALQASGGSKEAQRWIDGYEGGRLGNK